MLVIRPVDRAGKLELDWGMTKTEFVAKLAENGKFTQGHADKILNAVLASIEDALYRDGRIALPGFGVFQIRERSARPGRNPVTGEKLEIPPSRNVLFRPGKYLREILN